MTIKPPIALIIPAHQRVGPGFFGVGSLAAITLALTFLAAPLSLAEPSIAQRERNRRAAESSEAQQDLARGDRAYEAGNYEEAVEAYAVARGLLSASGVTGELYSATTQRYAQASVERARQLAKTGQRQEAHDLLDRILAPDVFPGYPGAAQLKAQIDDPIRYNPALTKEAVVEVDKVRRLLYEAEGFISLGRYEQSMAFYEEVLRIDPTNSAARRGMERATSLKSDYYVASRDEARARMLAEVDQAWETAVNPIDLETDPALLDNGGLGMRGRSAQEKLRSLIVPVVDMDGVGITEAIDYLRQLSINLDTMELDPEQRGISFVIDLGTGESDLAKKIESIQFDLKLRGVPLGKVLDYIMNATGTKARIDDYAVVVSPEGALSEDMVSRSFRVPPDFLSREALNDQGGNQDPFAQDNGGNQGLLPQRLTAKAFLQKQGVPFPEGSSANLTPRSSMLRVTNTRVNIDYIEQIVEAITEKEPVVVVIETRIITVAQKILEELGFDWITNGGNITGDMFYGGGTPGNGSPISDFGAPGFAPLTSGLRSGDGTANDNTIDTLLQRQNTDSGMDVGGARAPGIMTLAGVWDDGTVAMMMRGLNQLTGGNKVKKTTVVTRSGQTAVIKSTTEMIVPTEYEPPQLPNSVGGPTVTDIVTGETAGAISSFAVPATPTAFEVRELGCILEVEPLVGPNRQYIELSIKPLVRRFDGFIDYGTPITGGVSDFSINLAGLGNANIPSFITTGTFGQVTANSILMPVFSVIRSDANLTIADGATVVMGGLMADHHFKYEDKVPILGDIPFFGRFFRSESETSTRDSMVILVTVKLLDPSGRPYRDR